MKARRKLIGFILISLSVFCFSVCKQTKPKSIILITLDTTRADAIGVYNPDSTFTPNIDHLAQQGIVFENAYSPIPITFPAHASLFYSLPPHQLKIYNNGQIFLPSTQVLSLVQLAAQHNYATAAFTSLGVMHSRFGLSQGFQFYDDAYFSQRWYLNAGEVNFRVLDWLQNHKSEKFFLWIHYSDPHDPYAPPSLPADLRISLNGEKFAEICVQKMENLLLKFPLRPGNNLIKMQVLNPFPVHRDDYRISLNDLVFLDSQALQLDFSSATVLERNGNQILAIKDACTIRIHNPGEARDLALTAKGNINLFPAEKKRYYSQEIQYMDEQLGLLTDRLEKLGLMEKSVILLVGDHGEGLGEYKAEHGELYFGHIHYLQDVYLKVPFIIYGNGLPQNGIRKTEPVTLLDVAPTLCDLMGVKAPAYFSGQNLLAKKIETRPDLFQETYTPEANFDRFALRRFPWHLIFTPSQKKFTLYDLKKDPQEVSDIYKDMQNNSDVVKMSRDLTEYAQQILKNKGRVVLDKQSEEMLKSLGYIK